MPIFARPLSVGSIGVAFEHPVKSGQILVFDADIGAFVNVDPSVAGTAVTDAVNLGGANTFGVFAQKSGSNLLEFRSLAAGPGITVTDNGSVLTITASGTATTTASLDDYVIIVDADGDNAAAVFEIHRGLSAAVSSFVPPVLPGQTVPDVFIDNDPISGRGYIRTVNGFDFVTAGYTDQMILVLGGTLVEDGERFVDQVETAVVGTDVWSTIWFTTQWPNINLGGPRPSITIEQTAIRIQSNAPPPSGSHDPARYYEIAVWGADFSSGGLNWQPGEIVQISGTGSIDGVYTIWGVIAPNPSNPHPDKWSGLIFDPSSPLPVGVAEGSIVDPSPPGIQISRIAGAQPTGFSVATDGTVTATRVTVSSATPTAPDELTRKDYVDTELAKKASRTEFLVSQARQDGRIGELEERVRGLSAWASPAFRWYMRS